MPESGKQPNHMDRYSSSGGILVPTHIGQCPFPALLGTHSLSSGQLFLRCDIETGLSHLFDCRLHDVANHLDLGHLAESQYSGDGLIFDHRVPLWFEDVDKVRDG